ncbi:MAG: hypothetical protein EBS97_06210 [Verrucomicrobia bacterium]|nr:hypothetical protein [Verrucomicrobiota bacterium]
MDWMDFPIKIIPKFRVHFSRFAGLFLIGMWSGPLVQGATNWVSTSGNDSTGNGITTSPYATLQKAIDSSVNGDVVIIRSGTYSGAGNRDINLRGKSITVTSLNGPDTTILDLGRAKGFVAQSTETTNTVVNGLTLSNGYVESSRDWDGDSIISVSGTASLTVRNCIFKNNETKANYVTTSTGIIQGRDTVVVDNCLFYNNTIGGGGWTSVAGGGAYVVWGLTEIRRSTIANNTLYSSVGSWGGYSGGIRVGMAGNSRGNLVWGNSPSFFPAWSGFPSSSTPSQIWAGWAGTNAASYSLAQGGVTGPQITNTILTNAPSFVSTNTGNFALATGSPGIDAGDPSSPLDPDGTRADIGYRSDRFVPPVQYGFNYLRFAASQAGSDADIDNLVITDLDRNVVVYSNSFSTTNLSDFRTMFEADTPALSRNLQYGNTNYVRVVNGRLRMESIGYSGGDGRDTYESWAGAELKQKLPANFELSFIFNRLSSWAGHFAIHIYTDPIFCEQALDSVFSGNWFHSFTSYFPSPINALPAQLSNSSFYTSDTTVKIVKNGAQAQMYINGSLVATAQLGAVTDSDGDGLTDRFEEGSVRYSRVEWGRKYSWADARTHAAGWGRYRGLATVTSEAERTAVLSLFSSTSDLLWLGGTDEVAEGSWKWISGETWGFVPSGSTLSSGTADLDYLRMQGSGAWTSQASSQTNAYLLEAGYRTSASNPDTDGDGISDLDEYLLGLSPVDGVGGVSGTVPVITSTNSFSGTVGVAFSNTVTASGSTPITFSASNLPAGLTNSTNGLITGTPTIAGTNITTITASNAAGSVSQAVTFVIAKGT